MYSDLVHLKTMLVGMFDDTAITDAMISQGQTDSVVVPAGLCAVRFAVPSPRSSFPPVSVCCTHAWAAGARLRGAAGRRQSALGSLGALVDSAMAASCVDGQTQSPRARRHR